jgi:hypothetical protein
MRLLHRPAIVRWEAATPESLTAAMATLETSRRPVFRARRVGGGLFSPKFSALPAARSTGTDSRCRHVAPHAVVEAGRSRTISPRRKPEHHPSAMTIA